MTTIAAPPLSEVAEGSGKRHRGERWGAAWMQGAAPTGEESAASAALPPSRRGVRRRRPPAEPAEETPPKDSARPSRPRLSASQALDADASERAAQEAVGAGDFSLARVLRVLALLPVPASYSRKNVTPPGQDYVHGMLLGLYLYGGTAGVSKMTAQHPWLTRLLTGALRAVSPDFPFTSIQVNYGYASRPHVDKNNLGTSFIVGLGDYSGGELWVHDDDGEHEFVLQGDEDVSGFYHVGRHLRGKVLQIKGTWTVFDGNLLHFTKPFDGERYSIIFFTSDRYQSVSQDVQDAMRAAGFDFDWGRSDLESVLQDKHRRRAEIFKQVAAERAEESRRQQLARGRCIGRVWAGAWGLRCTAICEDGSEFCGSHARGSRWETHGRMDGPLPPAKRDEMAFHQQRLVSAGKRPPVREGATLLVPIPGWPETSHLAEEMKSYGTFRGKGRK